MVVIVAVLASGYPQVLFLVAPVLTRFVDSYASIYLPTFIAGFISIVAITLVVARFSRTVAVCLLLIGLLGPVAANTPAIFVDTDLILGGLVAYVLTRHLKWNNRKIAVSFGLTLLLWLNYVASSWQSINDRISTEIQGGGWFSDPVASIKIFYLMKHGMGYYQAYLTAKALNADVDPSVFYGSSFLSWRSPFLYSLWQIFPSATYLYAGYLVLVFLGIASAYAVFSGKSKKVGLLAATILVPYFATGIGLGSLSWLEWEFWGSLFSIIGFAFYARSHRKLAVIPAFFAAACKETLSGALLGGLIGSLIRRDKLEIVSWSCGLVAYVGYTVWHFYNLSFLHVTVDTSTWVWHGGVDFISACVQFALPYFPMALLPALIGLSIIGVVLIRPIDLAVYAFATTLLPMIALLIIGKTYDAYWGVIFVPFVLLMTVEAASELSRSTLTLRWWKKYRLQNHLSKED